MKKIKSCIVCSKSIAQRNSYQAEIEKLIKNPITGAYSIQIMKGFVCIRCNRLLGYKTSKKKLDKIKEN